MRSKLHTSLPCASSPRDPLPEVQPASAAWGGCGFGFRLRGQGLSPEGVRQRPCAQACGAALAGFYLSAFGSFSPMLPVLLM